MLSLELPINFFFKLADSTVSHTTHRHATFFSFFTFPHFIMLPRWRLKTVAHKTFPPKQLKTFLEFQKVENVLCFLSSKISEINQKIFGRYLLLPLNVTNTILSEFSLYFM